MAIEAVFGQLAGTVVHVGLVVIIARVRIGAAEHRVVPQERKVAGGIKRGQLLAFFGHGHLEIEVVHLAGGGVKEVEFDLVSRGDVQGHADPGSTFEIEGLIHAHGLVVHGGEDGHAGHGLSVEGDLGDVGGGNNGQHGRAQVGLVAGVIPVADAVSIFVLEAVAVAVVSGIGIGAGAIVVGGVIIVVAGRCIGAAVDFVAVADAVPVLILEALSVTVESVLGEFARAVLVGGGVIIVAGFRIGAAVDLEFITDPILIGVREAVAVAVVSGIGIGAGAVVDGGVVIIVAGRGVQTAGAGSVLTGSIVIGGFAVVVAGRRIGTSADFEVVTDPVAIGVGETGAVAIVASGSIEARAIVIRGIRIVIAGQPVLAARNFEFVTDSVAIGVVQAVLITIVSSLGVFTGVVVGRGFRIEVAGLKIRTPFDLGIRTEEKGVSEFGLSIAIDEHLAIDLSAEFSGGGELADQDLQIGTGNAVGIAVQGIPCASDHVINCDVVAGQSAARVEVGHPGVVRGLDRADARFADGRIGHTFKTDGDPAVISEVGVDREQQAVDAIRSAGTEGGVVEIRGRVDVGRIQGVT